MTFVNLMFVYLLTRIFNIAASTNQWRLLRNGRKHATGRLDANRGGTGPVLLWPAAHVGGGHLYARLHRRLSGNGTRPLEEGKPLTCDRHWRDQRINERNTFPSIRGFLYHNCYSYVSYHSIWCLWKDVIPKWKLKFFSLLFSYIIVWYEM